MASTWQDLPTVLQSRVRRTARFQAVAVMLALLAGDEYVHVAYAGKRDNELVRRQGSDFYTLQRGRRLIDVFHSARDLAIVLVAACPRHIRRKLSHRVLSRV